MSLLTNFLELFKWDTSNSEDKAQKYDIEKSLNENWDKIDTSIEELTGDIADIKEEQTEQNDKITALETTVDENTKNITSQESRITALEEENTELKEDIEALSVSGQASGESIDLYDSSNARVKSITLSGNSEQETREGYNLLDYLSYVNSSVKGLTVEKNEETGYITVNGTPTGNYAYVVNQVDITDILEDGETYTLWQENYDDTTQGVYLQIAATNIETEKVTYITSIGSSNTVTVDKSTYTYKYNVQTGTMERAGTFENYTNRYMLYKGTDEKEFELYGAMPSIAYPSEVKACGDSGNINVVTSNKNLAPVLTNNTVENQSTLICKCKKGDTFTMSLKASANSTSERVILRTSDLDINDFTTSTNDYTESITLYTNEEDNVGTLTSSIDGILYLRTSTTPSRYIFEYLQIEKGSTATDYVEHKGEEITIPTQQAMLEGDYFEKTDGVWKEIHVWKKTTLTGSEIYHNMDANTYCQFLTGSIDDITQTNNNYESDDVKLTMFTNSGITAANRVRINVPWTELGLTADNTNAEKIAAMKAILNSKNETMYYKLETAEKLTCTDEQIVALEKLQNMRTYKNITHIYSTDEVEPNIEVVYAKDLETILSNLTNEEAE